MAEDLPNPPDIELDEQVFELAFHPTADMVACGTVTGKVFLYKYAVEGNEEKAKYTHHKGACRALRFSKEGTALFTASSDKSIQVINTETNQVAFKKAKAHSEAINCLYLLDENTLASGDDVGCVKLWDLRTHKVTRTYTEQTDFISDLAFDEDRHTLLAPCGDGTLGVFDIRQNKPIKISDNLDDELLSVAIVKNGNKVVCGSQGGILNIFSWGRWGDISDRFPGHPNSVDTLLPVGDSLLCTGSSDGLIRIVTIQPNKFVGVIGEHEDFPIERIRLSRDDQYLGSCSHDNTVKLWNITYLFEEGDDEEDAGELPDVSEIANKNNAMMDLDLDEDSDSDDSDDASMDSDDDSSDDDTPPPMFNRKRKVGASAPSGSLAGASSSSSNVNNRPMRKAVKQANQIRQPNKKNFFSDL